MKARLAASIFMKNILLITAITCLLTGESLAQRKDHPRFEDFLVVERFKGSPAHLNFRSHPEARKFRTMLRDGVKRGAVFAGHYAINYWGCGTECIRIGIVDLKTGQVYITPFYTSVGVATRIDSSLLIIAPPKQIKKIYGKDVPGYIYPRYFQWKNNRLILIYPEKDKGLEEKAFWK